MTKHYPEITAEVSANLAKLRADAPELMRGFGGLGRAAMASGSGAALDTKTLELIAMALSVAARCDPCLGFHAEALVKAGCTRAELEAMLGVCVYMGGGPSLMYAGLALQAFEQFQAAAASTSA